MQRVSVQGWKILITKAHLNTRSVARFLQNLQWHHWYFHNCAWHLMIVLNCQILNLRLLRVYWTELNVWLNLYASINPIKLLYTEYFRFFYIVSKRLSLKDVIFDLCLRWNNLNTVYITKQRIRSPFFLITLYRKIPLDFYLERKINGHFLFWRN